MNDPATGAQRRGAVSRAELAARRDALRSALERGGDRLPEDHVRAARELEARIRARTSLSGTRTVVALAGATGSGKSSLFNAFTTEPVSRIGARRPTTSKPAAAVWGDEPSDELLDWLGVDTRHHVPPSARDADRLDGLVLLDLPDFDSRVSGHRKEADRILELTDVFVWVTDPQKYADAVMHDDYVRRMAGQAAVTVVVLNQIDRLPRESVQECVRDLRRLLAKDGLTSVSVVATSAVRGTGLPALVERVSQAVQTKNAGERRLLADLRAQASVLRKDVADGEAPVGDHPDDGLVDALSRASGVPVMIEGVERDYREHALRRTSWLPARRLARPRPVPVQRGGLERVVGGVLSRKDTRMAMGDSSEPSPTPAMHPAVDVAAQEFATQAAEGLPPRWAESVHDAVAHGEQGMYDALDREVADTTVQDPAPQWWSVVSVAQWVLGVIAAAGLVWLLVLAGLRIAGTHTSTPGWGFVTAPLLMLVGGVVIGVVLALLSRWWAAEGARRRAATAELRLKRAISAAAEAHVVTPVQRVLLDHAATREQLDRAVG